MNAVGVSRPLFAASSSIECFVVELSVEGLIRRSNVKNGDADADSKTADLTLHRQTTSPMAISDVFRTELGHTHDWVDVSCSLAKCYPLLHAYDFFRGCAGVYKDLSILEAIAATRMRYLKAVQP